ncbi:uncharacterized protein PgNI_09084 [Pyricularia grisea]|uniref:Endoglucanase n=1 Tax=Pyricularia grisea TaxID=148305 RepID=A0A6P8ATT2_PYRGI|nr:uncharacterized protein PgNI_09084 [Pyricularia grisea]TLD05502.1 hypothetical protein PgNI_09084 [Pyricularia grisea]
MHFALAALAALFGQTLASTLTDSDTPTNSSALERRHIEMVYPNQRNFDNQEWGHFNPLAPDGSNYPCRPRKGLQLKVKGSPTQFTAGVKFEVKFAGEEGKGAVHGGGSCQFSLSKGHSPNKDTRFYVIKSIEGGCPKRNSDGNLKPGEEPDKYDVEIPPQFEPGDWVFAWTWINRIGGEPEYYMNCSPIRIVAGAEKSSLQRRREQGSPKDKEAAPEVKQPGTEDKEPGSKGKEQGAKEKDIAPKETKKPSPSGKELGGIDQYPGVFMANLGQVSGGCTTTEALRARKAILYPHPGSIVERGNGDADPNLIKQPCDGNPHNKNR